MSALIFVAISQTDDKIFHMQTLIYMTAHDRSGFHVRHSFFGQYECLSKMSWQSGLADSLCHAMFGRNTNYIR